MKEKVIFNDGKTAYNGFINIPDKVENYPIVILFDSLMKMKYEEDKLLPLLSDELEKNNIASISFDYCRDNKGKVLTDLVNAAEQIINYVYLLEDINKEKITVVGYSIDSAIASIAAAKVKNIISKLCLISPVCSIHEVMQKMFSHSVSLLNHKDAIMFDLSNKWITDIQPENVVEILKNYNAESMIIYSTNDSLVPLNEYINYKKIYNGKCINYPINGNYHSFYGTMFETKIINTIVDFIK